MFAQGGFVVVALSALSFVVPLLVGVVFLVVLFRPGHRWKLITYRRAGVLFLICVACEAMVALMSAFRSIRYYWTDAPHDLHLDSVTLWMNWAAVPFSLFSATFAYVSLASLVLLFLRDKGVDVVEALGTKRRGLDPYN
ncbi:hypothetical protein [Candidatus Phaeomarinobacter ectocarpi]|nr:hypothetical protein [Candidatus Phaeomarinobacter ectocarpi]